jgi:hypothetical protein
MTKVLHSIGYPALQTTEDREGLSPRDSKLAEDLAAPSAVYGLIRLFIRIQKLSSTGSTQVNPPPWHLESSFRALQNELETVLIRRPIDYQPDTDIYNTDAGSVLPVHYPLEEILFSLMWHNCVLVLNRNFLPIPERQPDPAHGKAASIKSINFPLAPALFLEERIRACEASAAALSKICQEIVSRSDFFQVCPSNR